MLNFLSLLTSGNNSQISFNECQEETQIHRGTNLETSPNVVEQPFELRKAKECKK